MKAYQAILLSILSGLLFALSWPDRGFAPLAFVAFVPLLFVQQKLGKSNKRGIFWYAWLTFLIWNALTTWWIWYSTSVGALLAIVLNSLFVAVVFLVFHFTMKKVYANSGGMIALVFYWISWEYFHMNWDLTWSWLNLGNVFATYPKWIQWYEYTGTLGGSVWVIVVNILIFSTLKKRNFKEGWLPGSLAIIAIIIPVLVSYNMYNNYTEVEKPVEVVVVQPNSDPYNEQYDTDPLELVEKNIAQAESKITDSTDFVVFPESTLYDGYRGIWEDHLYTSPLIGRVDAFIKKHPRTSVVIGASSQLAIKKGEPMTNAARKFSNSESYYYSYNSAFLIDSTGDIQIHHKSKLTPGVEILPSWGILKPIEKLALDLGGTVGTLGRDKHPVALESASGIIVSPIICYESIYGEFVAQSVKQGAVLIFVITNDGWWGNTPGHRQHFDYSILRAIETRRSIARAANTGISAYINQRGDVFQKTKYWEPAVLNATINTNSYLTYYVKNGDYLARISLFVSALLILLAISRSLMKKPLQKD